VVVAAAAGVFGAKLLAKPPGGSLKFTIKTFEPQSIFNARFMPDGETIVFSSALIGNAPHLFEIRPGTMEARPVGPPNTHLLSVSSKGELAVLSDATYRNHRIFAGRLSLMALDGATQVRYEDVRDADWSPAGDDLALVRVDGTGDALEYPPKTVLYHSVGGYLSDPRVSPDGTRVAFMEHPSRYDDRGYLKVVDRSKTVVTLAGEFWGEQGVAWSPDGAYVMFAASGTASGGRGAGDMTYQINRVSPDGRTPAEFALTSPGNFTILDISKSGRWLATRDETRFGFIVKDAGQTDERDLTWLDKCWGANLSHDGKKVLFSDGNAGPDYGVAWRKTDGSPVVHLGEGDFIGESPDGKWVLATIPSTGQLIAYPMGVGDPRKLTTGAVTHVTAAAWLPDSQHIAISGTEPGKPTRLYKISLSGDAPSPIFDTAISTPMFLPDGIHGVAFGADGQARMYSMNGDAPTPIKGLQPADGPVAVTSDGRGLLVQQGLSTPLKVDRIDLTTGARTFFKAFGPPDQAGLVRIYLGTPAMKPDASAYAYGYLKRLSTLFAVTPAAK
jgi:Tol biopolymer transport system component